MSVRLRQSQLDIYLDWRKAQTIGENSCFFFFYFALSSSGTAIFVVVVVLKTPTLSCAGIRFKVFVGAVKNF